MRFILHHHLGSTLIFSSQIINQLTALTEWSAFGSLLPALPVHQTNHTYLTLTIVIIGNSQLQEKSFTLCIEYRHADTPTRQPCSCDRIEFMIVFNGPDVFASSSRLFSKHNSSCIASRARQPFWFLTLWPHHFSEIKYAIFAASLRNTPSIECQMLVVELFVFFFAWERALASRHRPPIALVSSNRCGVAERHEPIMIIDNSSIWIQSFYRFRFKPPPLPSLPDPDTTPPP